MKIEALLDCQRVRRRYAQERAERAFRWTMGLVAGAVVVAAFGGRWWVPMFASGLAFAEYRRRGDAFVEELHDQADRLERFTLREPP